MLQSVWKSIGPHNQPVSLLLTTSYSHMGLLLKLRSPWPISTKESSAAVLLRGWGVLQFREMPHLSYNLSQWLNFSMLCRYSLKRALYLWLKTLGWTNLLVSKAWAAHSNWLKRSLISCAYSENHTDHLQQQEWEQQAHKVIHEQSKTCVDSWGMAQQDWQQSLSLISPWASSLTVSIIQRNWSRMSWTKTHT